MAQVRDLREKQKVDPNDTICDKTLKDIASVARSHDLRVEQKTKYPTKIGLTTDRKATDVCGDALALVYPCEDRRWVYQFLSGYAHGLGYALEVNVTTRQTVGGLRFGRLGAPVKGILLCGTANARVHHKALEMLGHHAGLADVPRAMDERTDIPWL